MPDPFKSAYLKLAWGREHIDHLESAIADFFEKAPCERFREPHPDKPGHTVEKIRAARELPDPLSMIAGDAVDNLRAALDHAIFAISVPAEDSESREAYFPFARNEATIDNKIKGRCRDVPKEVWPLLRSFKPYKGENDLLFALNLACNRNKHALILEFQVEAIVIQKSLRGIGFMSIPLEHVWDHTKKEMELFTCRTDTAYNADFAFRTLVVIPEIPIQQTEQAFTTLRSFAGEVERILLTIETEARSLGLIK